MKYDSEERFPLVDESGRTIGSATRAECHDGSKRLHPVVHLHVVSPSGAVLLQKRSMTKDIQPGKWDTAVGGHVDYGEEISDALKRETLEELGIDAEGAELLTRYVFESDIERELVNTYCLRVPTEGIVLNIAADEVDETRFWSIREIEENLGKGVFTPNFEKEYANIIRGKI